jgi:hypothetical protein
MIFNLLNSNTLPPEFDSLRLHKQKAPKGAFCFPHFEGVIASARRPCAQGRSNPDESCRFSSAHGGARSLHRCLNRDLRDFGITMI